MSLIHKLSDECMKSELDIFEVPPTQRSIESGQWIEYYPLSALASGPIEYLVKGSTEEYIDLSQTFLYVQATINDSADKGIEAKSKAGPANLFLHSLFSQVDVSLNDTVVTSSINTYPYRALLETIANHGSDAKETHLTSALFFKDNNHESIDVEAGTNVVFNNGYLKRRSYMMGKKNVELFGRIHADIFFQNRYLINNVSLKRLSISRSSFCVMAKDTSNFRADISQAILLVRKVKINPEVMLAHAKILENATAKYPIKRVHTKIVTIPKNNFSIVEDNISNGPLPNKILLCMVDCDAYNGKYNKNPFNFKHNDLSRISFEVDGKEVPYKALELDYDKDLYIRAYYSMFNGVDKGLYDNGNGINRDDYKNGNNIFCFDLTGDLCSSNNFNLLKQGNLRLNLVFKQGLPNSVNCIIYMEFDNVIEINKNRQVFFDYTI